VYDKPYSRYVNNSYILFQRIVEILILTGI